MKKFVALLALMLPLAVMAQEYKDTTVALPQVETTMRLAAELSKFGYANKDALSLIQAARLSKQAGFTVQSKEKAETGGKPAAEGEKQGGKVSLDAAQLLADAKEMAHGDKGLLALINEVNGDVRGATDGKHYHRDRVLAHDYDIYNVRFRGNELAIVTVVGDGDTDLDLYIYDANGNLVDSDTDYTDDCVCTWTPRWTGNFRIKIVNRGNVYNNYVIRTN